MDGSSDLSKDPRSMSRNFPSLRLLATGMACGFCAAPALAAESETAEPASAAAQEGDDLGGWTTLGSEGFGQGLFAK